MTNEKDDREYSNRRNMKRKFFQKALKEKWEKGLPQKCVPVSPSWGLRRGAHLAGLCSWDLTDKLWRVMADSRVTGQVGWPHPTLGCDYPVTQTGSDQLRVDALRWYQISLLWISLLKRVLWPLHLDTNYVLGTPAFPDVNSVNEVLCHKLKI